MLRFSIAVSTLLVACATKSSGIDSESHFACHSDADCAVHAGRSICMENVCEPPDASTSENGGSVAMGGGGATNTTGGAAGRGGAGDGGRSFTMPDAMPPPGPGPETGPPAPDAGICRKCTSGLTQQQSLDCYCQSHECDADLATALRNSTWEKVDEGCGLVVVHRDVAGGRAGQMEAFGRSGRLVGAMKWNDVLGSACISPNDNSEGLAAGGNSFVPNENPCGLLGSCTLKEVPDSGFGPCDLHALLNEVGVDAGPPCQSGEILANVCTACVSGCNRMALECVQTCNTQDDCTAAHAPGTCVDSICQMYCPF